ncbi:sugar epimerase [Polaribacter sp. IC063]|uniref:sugar epimerase n=1 Tax=Polaribacter sp. IC063 TaxID=57031 RepID=UPI0011BE33A1|nr:sugar epimerase [Polaribacter sp. IC063]TXD51442.1 sugar epimerase [Polaribacter sp. IC063]
MAPLIISGGSHKDNRGVLSYNNLFDAGIIKRIYVIENNLNFIRRWQGHKIEQRWFSAIQGSFIIQLIKIDNWQRPNKDLDKISFTLKDESLDVLQIPAGYITSIRSLTEGAKLLVMSDYILGAVNDDYKYATDYFTE